MRVALASLSAVLLLQACHRDPPATTRPGEIVPLDPAGLARIRSGADAGRPLQPALRVLAWDAVIANEVARNATAAALSEFGPAIVRRLEALDAWSPRAQRTNNGAHLTFALGRATLTSLVREQLARPGYVELLVQERCPKFNSPQPLENVRWVTVDGAYDVPMVDPNAGGVASLASLRAAFTAFPLPAHLQWAHGAQRTTDGEISRRGYCVRSTRLAAPSFSEMRATLDPSTLAPMLEVTLDTQGLNTYAVFTHQISGADDGPIAVLLGIDGEVMGPVRFVQSDAGPAKIQVIPNSRMGSVSPELVGALWRSGPIPVPFTIEESAPPTAK